MKIRAVNPDQVLRSLRRAGLSDKQARRLLNRALLCLDYIGAGRRVSVKVFERFNGEVRLKGHRLRFHQVLQIAKLIKQTRPPIQDLFSAEYKATGKPEVQEIELDKREAQIRRKIDAVMRRAERSDKTLQWLNRSVKHSFESSVYFATQKPPQWPTVALERAFAGIVSASLGRQIRERYLRSMGSENLLCLDNGFERKSYRRSELSNEFELYAEVGRFADSLCGKPCKPADLEALGHGRITHMIRKEGFEYLQKRFQKDIVEAVTGALREKNFLCATDGLCIYAENSEALEAAFVAAVQYRLGVDITLRDKPVLTPLYIYQLRQLYASKHEVDLSEVPRVKAGHWKPPDWMPKRRDAAPLRFAATCYSIQEAKDFYGVDPDAEEAEAVTLYEARRQIDRRGSIRASNAQECYWQLEEMNHALPIEPTRQEWELTPKGIECLIASSVA